MLVFSDFACTTCDGLEPALKAIRDEFPNDVQIVFKHNPDPGDAKARAGARGRGRSRPPGQVLGDARPDRGEPGASSTPNDLAGYAKTLGLDAARVRGRRCDAHTHRGVVERDILEAKALGATGTLTLFINGRRGNGVPPAACSRT